VAGSAPKIKLGPQNYFPGAGAVANYWLYAFNEIWGVVVENLHYLNKA